MNTSRATVGIAVIFLAAVLTLAGNPHAPQGAPAFTGDPSVPPASEVFRAADPRTVALGNVEDMAY